MPNTAYFWIFIPSIQDFQLCLHPQVPWCCSGATGRAGIVGCSFVISCQKGQLANPTPQLQPRFLRPPANPDSTRVLKTKCSHWGMDPQPTASLWGPRTPQKCSPSDFCQTICKFKAKSTSASTRLDKSGFIG